MRVMSWDLEIALRVPRVAQVLVFRWFFFTSRFRTQQVCVVFGWGFLFKLFGFTIVFAFTLVKMSCRYDKFVEIFFFSRFVLIRQNDFCYVVRSSCRWDDEKFLFFFQEIYTNARKQYS